MKNLYGIVQGRLSCSPKNRLQFFPKNWNKEFNIAKKINYDFIEFFSERKFNINNPIWNEDLIIKYKKNAKNNNLKIINFCDDFIIANSINNKNTKKYLFKLLTNLQKLNVKNLILPMYGKSNLTDKNYNNYINVIKKILLKSKNIKILIESNISPEKFILFKNKISSKKLMFLFDTGNRICLKRDLYKDFELMFKNVGHIHLKDRNIKKKNSMLGTGLVDFDKFFKILKKKKYKKHFTFETTRGTNPIMTAIKNLKFIKKKFNEKK